jgi:hypothetical protein
MIDRLPHNANTEPEVYQYFKTRGLQLAPNGFTWSQELRPVPGGFLTHFNHFDGKQYDSFYVTAENRGKGFAGKMVDQCKNKIVTVSDCNIAEFLVNIGADFCVETGIFDSIEYEMIQSEYGDRRAKRSGVFLMNHIDEGIYIMHKNSTSRLSQKAFCLHPLLQADEDLVKHFDFVVPKCDKFAVALALEYRNIANQWLSDKVWIDDTGLMPQAVYETYPPSAPLKGVMNMLVADKIQNYKDFLLYHRATHPRSDALDTYFKCWLNKLGVVDMFPVWMDALQQINPP